MEQLKKELYNIIDKYNFYDEIEPKLSVIESSQFEILKEYVDRNKTKSLQMYINQHGIETMVNKLIKFINLNNNEINLLKKMLKNIIEIEC
jgi:hypothetical protein